MIDLIRDNLPAIRSLCDKHHVHRLCLIGSAARNDFNYNRSDLDFVVDYTPEWSPWEDYWGLQEGLQAIFDRPIDLIERSAQKSPYLIREIEDTQHELFAA